MAKRHKKQNRRRRFVRLVLLLAFCFELYFSNAVLQTEQFSFASSRLPDEFSGLRIAVLTDLHGARFGEDNEKLLSAVSAAQPDIIALVGDLADKNTKNAGEYARSLGASLSAIAPTYYVTGNHEWGDGAALAAEVKKQLADSGVTVLTNEYRTLTRGGETIVLAGADDPNARADQETPEALRAEVYFAESDCFTIFLSHRNTVEKYDALGFDLTLCGHGHGGIVRIPLLGRGVFGTDRHFFPAYDSGMYALAGERACFVSRGLGNNGRSLRLFNRPQVAVITLEGS